MRASLGVGERAREREGDRMNEIDNIGKVFVRTEHFMSDVTQFDTLRYVSCAPIIREFRRKCSCNGN